MSVLRTAVAYATALIVTSCADGGSNSVGAGDSTGEASRLTRSGSVANEDPARTPPAVGRSLPATAPPPGQRLATCSSSNLTLEQAETDGAGGNAYVFVTVRNTSRTYCRLSGRPGLRNGPSVVATSPGRALGPGGTTSPTRLAPDMVGQLTLAADNQLCRDDPGATYRRYRQLTLTWGDGQVLILDGATGPAELDSCTDTVQVTPWYTSGT